ncbi:MAG: hypothetical protein HYY01_02325 [Chloroflexi bacterium]|nr:hypothetical protein [Chloroflexota bacterium]
MSARLWRGMAAGCVLMTLERKAMKTVRLNFTIPEDTATALKSRVGQRKRSAFVAAAIREKLSQMEREELTRLLIEGYQARRQEGEQINAEWEAATLENWPE